MNFSVGASHASCLLNSERRSVYCCQWDKGISHIGALVGARAIEVTCEDFHRLSAAEMHAARLRLEDCNDGTTIQPRCNPR